ncbi:hypothetical protein GCM10009736_66550 [Actinomadura bangladeshensis]
MEPPPYRDTKRQHGRDVKALWSNPTTDDAEPKRRRSPAQQRARDRRHARRRAQRNPEINGK